MPAYLEEENLRILLPRLNNVLQSLLDNYEIIVVDTVMPMDNTREICAHYDVTYLNREGGNCFGNAVRTGISQAKGSHILFMDADGSHSPEFIGLLWMYSEQSDIVIASRYIEGGSTDNSRALIFMSYLVNVMYSFVLNLDCKDVSNNFKLYKAHLLKNLQLRCENFDIIEEILFKIRNKYPNTTIREVPFPFKKRMFGNTKRNLFVFAFSFFITLIKLRFGK